MNALGRTAQFQERVRSTGGGQKPLQLTCSPNADPVWGTFRLALGTRDNALE